MKVTGQGVIFLGSFRTGMSDVSRRETNVAESQAVHFFALLGAFTKFAKSNDYLRHVRLSVRVEQLVSHWTDFHEILYFSVFRKSVMKMQVSLKSGKNNGHFT
jgi:hypothetical protein